MQIISNRSSLRSLPRSIISPEAQAGGNTPTGDRFVGAFSSSRKISLSTSIQDTSKMSLDTYKGPLEQFGSFLVLDVEYNQVKNMRRDVEAVIGRKLDFLKLLRPEGEAHVTTFTPVEARRIIAREEGEAGKLSMDDIEAIAQKTDLKNLDLQIKGVGSGSKLINGNLEETFFLIVDSEKLRSVRHQINDLYLSRGGDPEQFKPDHFYPHITIGYTARDLHESDGVLKDKENSIDSRFRLEMK